MSTAVLYITAAFTLIITVIVLYLNLVPVYGPVFEMRILLELINIVAWALLSNMMLVDSPTTASWLLWWGFIITNILWLVRDILQILFDAGDSVSQ